MDILEMWSFIEYSYGQLSKEDKEYLEKEAAPFGKDPKFPGFDGNNESEYMGTASFIVNELERFEKFKGRNFNSHCFSIDEYKRMLSVFKNIRVKCGYGPMLAVDLATILKERIHPSNRRISE
jgi:hypothetical protein